MESPTDLPEEPGLQKLLAQARPVRLRPGFSDRVLAGITAGETVPTCVTVNPRGENSEAFSAEEKTAKARRGRGMWFGLLQVAACLAVAGFLWFTNHAPPQQVTEEGWIQDLASAEISPGDLALIANLHEFLEAEVSHESNAAWLESGNH
jgi:hypothetical protein